MIKKNSFILMLLKMSFWFSIFLLVSCKHLADTSLSTIQVVDNVLCFDDALSFVKMLNYMNDINAGIKTFSTNRSAIDDDFVSMMDVIPDSSDFQTEEDFLNYLSDYPKVLCESSYINSEGKPVTVYNLALTPQLASLVNPEGLVSVAGNVYDVLDDNQLENLKSLLEDSGDGRFVCSTFDGLTIAIPLFRGASAGPQYYVSDFTTTINGRSVVVQVWKGYCPLVLVVGGVGAEIGLYNPLPFCSSIWLPDYTHPVNLSYSLIYKGDGSTYLSMSNNTWWLNGWKVYESAPSLWGGDYTLKFSLNGSRWTW